MSDKKISQLTAATTPLAGTEVLPIVQGGSTVKVAVSDLTAGRAVTASELTVDNLNINGNTISTTDTNGDLILSPNGTGGVAIGTASTGNKFHVLQSAATGVAYFQGPEYQQTQFTDGIRTLYIQPYDNVCAVGTSSNTPLSFTTNNAEVMRLHQSKGVSIGVPNDPGADNVSIKGNLVIGTSGKGIDFSATSDGSGTMTSELLADYEEGTWTPTVTAVSGTITTVGTVAGRYTKIGRQVTVWATVAITDNGTGASALNITGLPYTPVSGISYYSGCGYNGSSGKIITAVGQPSSTTLVCRYYDATYPVATAQTIAVCVSYNV